MQPDQKNNETVTRGNNCSKKDSSISQTNSQKQRELRQTELRIRKWEVELKLREAKCTESYQGVSRLEDYVRKVEVRNVKLEGTVRTLKRKVDILERIQANQTQMA